MLPKAIRDLYKDRSDREYYYWYSGKAFLRWVLNKRDKAPKGSKSWVFWNAMLQEMNPRIQGAALRHNLYLQILRNDTFKDCNI